MEKMLQDIRINNELHNQKELPCKYLIKQHWSLIKKSQFLVEFSGMVLASNVWSLSGSMDCVLPEQVKDIKLNFDLIHSNDKI